MERDLDSAETWSCKRILKVSEADRVTNERILAVMNIQSDNSAERKPVEFLGYIIRREERADTEENSWTGEGVQGCWG